MSARRWYRYDMMGADEVGEHRHPQVVIREHFEQPGQWIPQSMGDQWWFSAEVRDGLPGFIRPMETPSDHWLQAVGPYLTQPQP